jgi:hypothetical protein
MVSQSMNISCLVDPVQPRIKRALSFEAGRGFAVRAIGLLETSAYGDLSGTVLADRRR